MKTLWCVAAFGLVVGVAALTVRSEEPKEDQEVVATITSGPQVAEHISIAGSVFTDVNLSGALFENVNMSKTIMHDINLTDLDLSAADLGGAKFKHIGPAPDQDGNQPRQRPVTFEEAMLCDSTFTKVDLSNVQIIECIVEGMTIDGVLVTDLIAAYKNQKK